MSDDECPEGGEHDWIKPADPQPPNHKYECANCRHFDLDDYE
jgi:hypothetical protein